MIPDDGRSYSRDMISQSLLEGFRLTHKNRKVMLYQLILIFTLHIFFLFLVILPLALAFEMLSIDVQEIKHFFTTITYPVNAVENYLKLAGHAQKLLKN
jgi:hypothetical protein